MNIKDVITKYEPFYKGGSGYTFQVAVDDFNGILKHIEMLEKTINEYETPKDEIFYMVVTENGVQYFEDIQDTVEYIKDNTHFEVDGEALATDLKYSRIGDTYTLNEYTYVHVFRKL